MEPLYSRECTVSWGESDPFGLVYYPNITAWLNDAEHEYLRTLDLGIDAMIARDRTTFVMGEIKFRFTGPAPYGHRVVTHIGIDRIGSKTIHWRCLVKNLTTGGPVADGEATRVYAHINDDKSLESRVIPDDIRERLLSSQAS